MSTSEEVASNSAPCRSSEPDERIVAALKLGLSKLTETVDSEDQFCTLMADTLTMSLRDSGFEEWANALRARFEASQTAKDGTTTSIAQALGQATGQFCGSEPEEARLRLARNTLHAVPECFPELESAAESTLRKTPGAQRILLSTLQQRASNFASNPRDLADLHFGDGEAFTKLRSQDLRVRDIWRSPPYLPPFFVHDAWAFDLLRRVDVDAYLQVLGELPHVQFASQIMERAARTANINELTSLLRKAPPAFDENGTLLSGGALALLSLAVSVKRWFGPEQYHPLSPHNVAVIDTATFEAESLEVLKALSARGDHMALGHAWLESLIWSSRTRSARRVDPDGHSSVERWFALISALARSLPDHPAPYDWIGEENPLWRNDRIYALLAVLVFRPGPAEAALGKLLKTCLTKGLVGSHAIEQLHPDQQACSFSIVALSIAALKDPVQWFQDAWAAIFSNRDRARRSHRNPNDDFQNIGRVAVFWALAGLAQLPAASPVKRALWVELEIATRESTLTDAFRKAGDAWCVAAQWLAAHWSSIFKDDPRRGTPGSLDDFLMGWAEPDADFAEIASALASHGVTAEQFSRSLPDSEILRAALQEAEFSRRIIHRPMPKFDLVALAAAVDVLGESAQQ
jgi:hypothetical protein